MALLLQLLCRGAGAGGAGGAIAPPIFLEIGEIVAFSTPNISRFKIGFAPKNVIRTPNILHLPAPLNIF